MSRIGKKPIVLPEKVKARVEGQKLHVEGPQGKHDWVLNPLVKAVVNGQNLVLTRVDESREAKQVHGMVRAIVAGMVNGAHQGFQKILLIEGVGFRAEAKGQDLSLTLGFSHPVEYKVPSNVKIAVEKQTKITLTSSDKASVGQVAANIRALRPPEPYKGKGIRYETEVVKRKPGKAAASGSSATGGAAKGGSAKGGK